MYLNHQAARINRSKIMQSIQETIERTLSNRYYRKVIRITAEDSPNVQYAKGQIANGIQPDNREIVPGVLPYSLYVKRRATWDEIRQCVGLDGQFYKGKEILLYPPAWTARAQALALALRGKPRQALAIGIDPAEGGDKTSMGAVDMLGLIEMVSRKTPDTSDVTDEALAFAIKHKVRWENVIFDRGGGGKQHADRLRKDGYPVRTVAFGESLTLDPRRGMRMIEERMDNKEEHYAYFNRRAEMYGELRLLIDPGVNPVGFAIDFRALGDYGMDLTRQMKFIPLNYDEGRLKIPPKNRPAGEEVNVKKKTLIELIGHSPDELDALVLAVWGMQNKPTRRTAGAM